MSMGCAAGVVLVLFGWNLIWCAGAALVLGWTNAAGVVAFLAWRSLALGLPVAVVAGLVAIWAAAHER
ncbi:MAG: hypothetical protein KGN77_02035 [Xanthomonadaceae bacterium]|nr:hypothetical protein [Xanthomonadaceae bacterium]